MSLRQLPELPNATAFASDLIKLRPEVLANWNPALAAAAADDDNVISILQPIGESFFSGGFTAQRCAAALRTIGDRDVIVHINSPGGRVDEGTAIYNMLRQHKGEVTVKILGMAGSIASIIAMAGDTIEIAKAGFVFVHNSEGGALGNRHLMEEVAADLKTIDEMMAQVYADRSGMTTRESEKLMDGRNNNGTLLNATVAVDKGLADKFLPGDAVTTDPKAKALLPANIAALRRLETLATSPEHASRDEVARLLHEVKAGMREAAEDVTREADVSPDLQSILAQIKIT